MRLETLSFKPIDFNVSGGRANEFETSADKPITLNIGAQDTHEFEIVTGGRIGPRGVGIASIEKTASDGLVDTYTILMTDKSTSTFTVTNGAPGVGIADITLNADYTLTLTMTDETQYTTDSIRGAAGTGIVSIRKTSSEGLVDTYTITMDDGSTSTFTVTNGSGSGAEIQSLTNSDIEAIMSQ